MYCKGHLRSPEVKQVQVKDINEHLNRIYKYKYCLESYTILLGPQFSLNVTGG